MSQNNHSGYDPRTGARRPVQQRPVQQRPAQRPVQQRPVQQRPVGTNDGFWKLVVLGVVVIIAGLVLQVMMPKGFPVATKKQNTAGSAVQAVTEIHSNGPVRINELMTSNGGVLTDENGATPDWIEIINDGASRVNLAGYTLSKSAGGANAFTFPNCVLEPGQCVIVYADSHIGTDSDKQFHAPFRLSSAGDVLMLFNGAKVAIDTVNIPAIPRNTVYARQSVGQWAQTDRCTPGLSNTEESYNSLISVTQASDMRITQVMTSNTTVNPDENGAFHDYIVITNTGASSIDISGWYLSDYLYTTRMWMFPEGTVVAPGSSLTVHASGLDRSASGHLHTNFRLSSEGETIILANPNGQPVDIAEVPLLKDNEAFSR